MTMNTTDIYPGQVQFFFEHMIQLPEGPATHSLAFVRWYDKADDRRSQFYCQIGNDDERDFYELSQDCIIPIHSILGHFIAGTMKIGKKIPKNIYQLFLLIKKFIYKLY